MCTTRFSVLICSVLLACQSLIGGPVTASPGKCADGDLGPSISSVSAEFDSTDQLVTVALTFCKPIDTSSSGARASYQVFVDHTAPFLLDADRNDDGSVNSSDACFDSSDRVMVRRSAAPADLGPGRILPQKGSQTQVLTYQATLPELGVPPGTRQLYIWAEVSRDSGNGNVNRSTNDSECADAEGKTIVGLKVWP
jgi:hypothetical protein